jgi:hypothetical protein
MRRLGPVVNDNAVSCAEQNARDRRADITATGHQNGFHAASRLPVLPAIVTGVAIGLLSGLTGTGGGIFLSPLLLATAWANARLAAGVTAPFNLLNSAAALSGNVLALRARCRPSCRTSPLPQLPAQSSARTWA